MTQANHPFSDPIDEMSRGYTSAQILMTANRLGVFPALGKGRKTVDELAEQLKADRRGLTILCDALTSLGLLRKEGEAYRNSDLALEYLLPDSPKSKIAILKHGWHLYERWGHLYDTVKTGRPAPEGAPSSGRVEDDADFARAMADVARTSAAQTAEQIPLPGARTMLDIGGGPGLYAIEFARRNPELRVTILDNANTLEVARAHAGQAGLLDRISFHPADALEDDLGGGFDFILLSNVAHSYSDEVNRQLVGKCARALAPGGRLCVKDFLLDPDRTSPPWAAVFAVNMLVNTDGGNCYTREEVRAWMEDAGLAWEGVQDVAVNSGIAMGRKG